MEDRIIYIMDIENTMWYNNIEIFEVIQWIKI